MIEIFTDDYFMQEALKEAHKAKEAGEIPVGAVVVCEKTIIARAHNQTEKLTDVTAHAEILAITAASAYLSSKFLEDCTLYVTLEPCVMCAGAIAWARIGKLVYGAADDKRGFVKYGRHILHRDTKVAYGVKEIECAEIMTSFFQELRMAKK